MTMDMHADFFALFGLPRRFEMDEAALMAAFHAQQNLVHPDRHVHLPEHERRLAMQWATRVNEGFATLRKPLLRAHYLLQLAGVDVGLDTNTAMPADFLMQQLEWREAIDEARMAGDIAALEQLHKQMRAENRRLLDDVAQQLDHAADYAAAAETVRKLMFIEKMQHQIDDALEALEG